LDSQLAIYISCAPEEFATLLSKVEKDVERLAYCTVSIADCPIGLVESDRLEWVEAAIQKSVGVIHFPGVQFGAQIESSDEIESPQPPSPRSIHHFEILTALKKSKQTWVILPEKGCTHDKFPKEPDELKRAQRSFIYYLEAEGLLYKRAKTDEHFNQLLTEHYYEPEDLDHRLARKPKAPAKVKLSIAWVPKLVVAILLLLAIGVGLYQIIGPNSIGTPRTTEPTNEGNNTSSLTNTLNNKPLLPLTDLRVNQVTLGSTFTTIVYAISELQLQILAGEPPLSSWSDDRRENALVSLLGWSTDELDAALLQPRTTDIQRAQAFLIFNERERADKEFDAIIDSNEDQQATSLALLGKAIIAQDRGDHQEALKWFQKNADTIDRTASPELWSDANHPVAFQLAVLRRFDESEKLLRKILETKASSKSAAQRRLAGVKRSLVRVLLATERAEEAQPIMQQVLESDVKVLGANHPWVALDHHLLASILDSLGNYEEAESGYRSALSIAEADFGNSSPQLLTTLTSLAEFLHMRGKLTEAEPIYRRALLIHDQKNDESSVAHASMLGNLAGLLFTLQKNDEAALLFQQSIERFEKLDGASPTPPGAILTNYARLLEQQGQTAEATATIRRAISITEKTLGKNHPQVATNLLSLARLLQQSQQNAEAEIHLRRALAIDVNLYGEYHASTARDLEHLTDFLLANGRANQAEGLIRHALEIREIKDGKKHQNYAANLDRLSRILAATKRRDDALQYSRQALVIYATLRKKSEKFARELADVLDHYRNWAPQDTLAEELIKIGEEAGWDAQEWKALIAR